MGLKDIFRMIKADRYTADGREEIRKAQEAIAKDAGLPDGTMRHRKDGDYIKQAGKWVPAKRANGAKKNGPDMNAEKAKHAEVRKDRESASSKQKLSENYKQEVKEFVSSATPERVQRYIKALRTPFSIESDSFEEPEKLAAALEEELKKKTESKPAAGSGSAPSNGFVDYEGAKKAIDEGKVVQWKSSDGEWHDVDSKTSTLVQARDIGVKMRIKTDAEGNPVKAKPEPSMDETRSKLLELEKRRRKFEKYPDMNDRIKLEQASLLSKAGFNSREEFEDFVKSEMPTDSAPRVLTGDCKIRLAKDARPTNGIYHWKSGDYRKEGDKYVKIGPGSGGAGKAPANKPDKVGDFMKAYERGDFGKYQQNAEQKKAESFFKEKGTKSKPSEPKGKNVISQVHEEVQKKSPEEIRQIISKLRTPNSNERNAANVNPDILANVYEEELKEMESKSSKPTKHEEPLYITMNKRTGFYEKAEKEKQKRLEALKNSPAEKRRRDILEKLDKGELTINPKTLKIESKTSDAAPRELTGDCKIRIRKG